MDKVGEVSQAKSFDNPSTIVTRHTRLQPPHDTVRICRSPLAIFAHVQSRAVTHAS